MCTALFLKFFFNKWSPNSYLFWMMEGFYIQKKMGDTKKTDHFRKMSSLMRRFPRWWKSQNIIGWTTFKLFWSSERCLFLFFVKSISRNFLDRRHRNHLHHSFNSKKIHTNFYLCLLAAVGFIIDIGLSQTERSRTQIHVIFGFCTVNLYTCFPEYKLVGIHWIL